jgi:hypothetical protein
MKKVKKFGAGDLVTGIGAVLLGKALYDKYKGKDDDEKEPEAVGGASRRPKTIEEQIGRKAEPKAESREEYLSKKTTPIKETGTFKGSDTAEPDLEYKSKPAAKKTTTPAKKAEPAAQPKKVESKRGLMDEPPAKLGSQGSFKFDSKAAEDVKSTPKPADDASKKTNKYGIGPYGAFGSIHKAMSEYKTPAEVRSEERRKRENKELAGMKKGGVVKSSASRRADGIAQRGKTKGRIC